MDGVIRNSVMRGCAPKKATAACSARSARDDLSAARKALKVNLRPGVCFVCLYIGERALAIFDDPLSHQGVVKILF
jgi:hypothetical protein